MMWPVQNKYGFIQIFMVVLFTRWTNLCNGASVVFPGTTTCDPKNRDPCSNFPDLCSTGGGLCVLKGPCEYECVCPPDGRRGRDCTGNDDLSNSPREEAIETLKGENLLNSLLVFPQDLFWDLNHVMRPEETVQKIQTSPLQSTPSTYPGTTTLSSATILNTKSSESVLITALLSTPPQEWEKSTVGFMGAASTPSPSMASPTVSASIFTQDREHLDIIRKVSTSSATVASTTVTIGSPSTSPLFPTPTLIDKLTTRMTSKTSSESMKLDDKMENIHAYQHEIPLTTNYGLESSTVGGVIQDMSSTMRHYSSTPGIPQTSSTTLQHTSIRPDKMSTFPITTPPNPSLTNSTLITHTSSADIVLPNDNLLSAGNGTTENITIARRENNTNTSDSPSDIINTVLLNEGMSFFNPPDTIQSHGSTERGNSRERFPGHEGFPTFFRDVNNGNDDKDPSNSAMSKGVHRVFFPIPRFEKIERTTR